MKATFSYDGTNPAAWIIHDPGQPGEGIVVEVPNSGLGTPGGGPVLYGAGWVVASIFPIGKGPESWEVVPRPVQWPESYSECKKLEQAVSNDIQDQRMPRRGNPLVDHPAAYRVSIGVCDKAASSKELVTPEMGQPAEYRARLEALTGVADGFWTDPVPRSRVGEIFQHNWLPVGTVTADGGVWNGQIDNCLCLDLTRQVAGKLGVDPAGLLDVQAGTYTPRGDGPWTRDEWKPVGVDLTAAVRPLSFQETLPPAGAVIISPTAGTWRVVSSSCETRRRPFGGDQEQYQVVKLQDGDFTCLDLSKKDGDDHWDIDAVSGPNVETHFSHNPGQRLEYTTKTLRPDLGERLDRVCASSFQDLWQASRWDIGPDKSVWIALPKGDPEPCTLREALCRATAIGGSKDDAVLLAQLKATNPGVAEQVTDVRNGLLQATAVTAPGTPGVAVAGFSEQQTLRQQQEMEAAVVEPDISRRGTRIGLGPQ